MDVIDAWFDAWNAHDAAALAALLADGGTYEDPDTAGPVPGEALAPLLAQRAGWIPDLALERGAAFGDGDRRAVEWVLRGRASGPYGDGIAATDAEVALPGVTVFELEGARLRAVRARFDRKALVEQAGLMALVQPIEQGRAKFGYSMRVPSGNPKPPGVIALTWIQGADESERERIRAHARQNVGDFLEEPGFLSIVTGFIGLRGFTVTAWEDEASMKRALSKHHATAMRELFGERFVASVWTSVWQPTRVNRIWVRCPACGSLEDVSDDHRACHACDAPLPERPAFW